MVYLVKNEKRDLFHPPRVPNSFQPTILHLEFFTQNNLLVDNRSVRRGQQSKAGGHPSSSKGRTNAAFRKRYDSTSSCSISPRIIVFAATPRGMGISRAQISNPTWHTCLVASRGRGSRVTVPDYQQIHGESIASQANRSIDWLIAWLIDEKSACDERVHVENENEPNGKWFRSIGRQQGNESFRRRRWRNICLFVSRLSTILVHENVYLSCVSWHASAKKKKKGMDRSFVRREKKLSNFATRRIVAV